METAGAPLTTSDPLAKCLRPVPTTLCSLPKVLAAEGCLPSEDTTMVPMDCPLRLPPGHPGPLMPLNQQAGEGGMVLLGVTDPDNQGTRDRCSTVGVRKEEHVWNTAEPMGVC